MKNKEIKDEVNTRWDQKERSEGRSKYYGMKNEEVRDEVNTIGCRMKKLGIK